MFALKLWSLCNYNLTSKLSILKSLRSVRFYVKNIPLFEFDVPKERTLRQLFNYKYDVSIDMFQFKTKTNSSLRQKWCFNMVSVLIWLGLIDEKEANDSPLIMTIKRGILCMQRQEYDKAEIILHAALKLAQEQVYFEAETHIYDLLANNAFEKGDLSKAEKLFINVLNRVLSKGIVQQNDESIVEISLKLATIYSKRGDVIKANDGFKFCFDSQQKRIEHIINAKSDELSHNDINSLALWGMCLDLRAKHFTTIGKYNDAIGDYHNAIKVCVKINGSLHTQTLVLFNDIATIYVLLNDFEHAIEYLKKAIDGAIRTESEDISTFYYNLGAVYLSLLNYNDAQIACRESLNFSRQLNDKVLEEKARQCLINAKNA